MWHVPREGGAGRQLRPLRQNYPATCTTSGKATVRWVVMGNPMLFFSSSLSVHTQAPLLAEGCWPAPRRTTQGGCAARCQRQCVSPRARCVRQHAPPLPSSSYTGRPRSRSPLSPVWAVANQARLSASSGLAWPCLELGPQEELLGGKARLAPRPAGAPARRRTCRPASRPPRPDPCLQTHPVGGGGIGGGGGG